MPFWPEKSPKNRNLVVMKRKERFHHYNKHLKAFARQLRNNSTKAEIRVWNHLLRARKMKGYPFLRQRPILNYIADFYCKELKLVIEIDGWTHEDEDIRKNDEEKQRALEEVGYTVLRFTDDEVVHHLEEVKRRIEAWIEVEHG